MLPCVFQEIKLTRNRKVKESNHKEKGDGSTTQAGDSIRVLKVIW
jgi:hypothetical protein